MKIMKPALLFIISLFLTILTPFSTIFTPILLIVSSALLVAIAVEYSPVYSLFSALFSFGIIYFFTKGIVISAIFPALIFLTAMGIYISLRLKLPARFVTLCGTVGFLGLIVFAYITLGGTFISDAVDWVKNLCLMSLDAVFIESPAMFDPETTNEIKQIYILFFEEIKIISPSILISYFLFSSYFTLKLSGLFARKNKFYENIPPFSELRASSILVVICIVAYFLISNENSFISGLASNIFSLISSFATICGLSFIDYLLRKKINSLLIRCLIYVAGFLTLTVISSVMIFLNPVLLLMFIGAMDSIFNYRLRMAQRGQNNS